MVFQSRTQKKVLPRVDENDMRDADDRGQPDDKYQANANNRNPKIKTAGQSACEKSSRRRSQAEKGRQQWQILEIGKYSNFGGEPTNDRQLEKQRQKANQKQLSRLSRLKPIEPVSRGLLRSLNRSRAKSLWFRASFGLAVRDRRNLSQPV